MKTRRIPTNCDVVYALLAMSGGGLRTVELIRFAEEQGKYVPKQNIYLWLTMLQQRRRVISVGIQHERRWYTLPQAVERLAYQPVGVPSEVPQEIQDAIRSFIAAKPDWDIDRIYAAAMSLFFLQNGTSLNDSRSYRKAARLYLDTLFKHCA